MICLWLGAEHDARPRTLIRPPRGYSSKQVCVDHRHGSPEGAGHSCDRVGSSRRPSWGSRLVIMYIIRLFVATNLLMVEPPNRPQEWFVLCSEIR
jgi:hypothetical protein